MGVMMTKLKTIFAALLGVVVALVAGSAWAQGGWGEYPLGDDLLAFAPATTPDPVNGAPRRNYYIDNHVRLTWNRISWTTAYQVEVAFNSTFTLMAYVSPELDANTLSTTTTPLDNADYFWRVHAKNSLGNRVYWSAVQKFTVNVPPTPPPPSPTP